MSVIITEHVIQPHEIVPIITDIEDALNGRPREHSIIAMLSMILIMTHPEITQEQLADGVRDISRYICLLLNPPDPQTMN